LLARFSGGNKEAPDFRLCVAQSSFRVDLWPPSPSFATSIAKMIHYPRLPVFGKSRRDFFC
jgi:hypothetical protein